MPVGDLPEMPEIRQLARVSPSRYSGLRQCALRGIWASSEPATLLPVWPTARLGVVAHRLVERASKGHLPPDDQYAIEREWTNILETIEAEMASSWLDRFLVPLQESVKDYEVRRIRACKMAEEIAKGVCPGGARSATDGIGTEVWVEAADGRVGGFIDLVRETSDGVDLVDYKTGAVLEQDSPGSGTTVKNDYVIQLRLYSALYAATYGTWPRRLLLAQLGGEEIEVVSTQAECSALLQEALQSMSDINTRIEHLAELRTRGETAESLAAARPTACRFCGFRPVCPSYFAESATREDEDWPHDVWGTVMDV